MPEPADLSVVILTYNEEANLDYCLRSVAGWTREIYVVDSGSTDRTVDIAREYGAHVYTNPFVTQAQQFNWALEHLPIATSWILRLDADEYVLPELAGEIQSELPSIRPDTNGLLVKRRVYFKDRWIRHGGYYPTWLLRIFRAGKGRCEDLEMDEHIIVVGATARLKNDIVDCNHKDLRFWLLKHEQFAGREARVLQSVERADESASLVGQAAWRRWRKRKVYGRLPLFSRAVLYFVYRYLLRGGFLDGKEGLVFHVLQGFWYRFYVDAKIWEAQKERTSPCRETGSLVGSECSPVELNRRIKGSAGNK